MARGAATTITVDGRDIALTNPGKVMYPLTGTTKADVVAYYRAVAPCFVAHNGWRPATRKRWVDGVGTAEHPGKSFFSKDLNSGTPDWVARVVLTHRERDAAYPLVNDAATLVWLGQIAALEIHVPQWRVGDGTGEERAGDGRIGVPTETGAAAGNPDRLVLDLDPGEGVGLAECAHVAHLCRQILDGMGLACVPVTSGSKGIHLYAALDGRTTTEQATLVARELARSLEADHPDLIVSDMKRALRGGKVFLDWSQNNGSKTTVAPYSLRGRERPYVAAPRTWNELGDDLRQLEYPQVLKRLERIGDPLAALMGKPSFTGETPLVGESPLLGQSRVVTDSGSPPVPQASAEGLPRIEPMLASPVSVEDTLGDQWVYETKWDGYRSIASVSDGRAVFRSRGGLDVSATYPELAELAEVLAGRAAVLDGEIVAFDGDGRTSFSLLQNRADKASTTRVHYLAFDVLHLDGRSLLGIPYATRRELLESLGIDGSHVHVPVTFGGDRELALRTTRELRLEGLMAKRVDGVYHPGVRSRVWLKIKYVRTQEVIVVGWTPGSGRRRGTLGSLLLAIHTDDGLAYVGKVGTGFTDASLLALRRELAPIERATAPLEGVPRAVGAEAHWVEPSRVGEVSYGEWTPEGRLRHPVWRGWRPDKSPHEARRADA